MSVHSQPRPMTMPFQKSIQAGATAHLLAARKTKPVNVYSSSGKCLQSDNGDTLVQLTIQGLNKTYNLSDTKGQGIYA